MSLVQAVRLLIGILGGNSQMSTVQLWFDSSSEFSDAVRSGLLLVPGQLKMRAYSRFYI